MSKILACINTYNVIRFDAVFRWPTTVYGDILPAFLLGSVLPLIFS